MSDLIRLSILGSALGGEVWSVNPVFEITTGSEITFFEAQAIVTAVNLVTIPAALRLAMSSTNSVIGCRVEARSQGGTLEALAEGLRPTAVTGTGASPHPPQIAWVVSLRTTEPGASGRGRLYWPANGMTLSPGSLRPSVTDTTSFISAFRDYLALLEAAVDGAIDETVDLAVWSRTRAALYHVNKVMAGDVLDTQRRRRDQLAEAYIELSYP